MFACGFFRRAVDPVLRHTSWLISRKDRRRAIQDNVHKSTSDKNVYCRGKQVAALIQDACVKLDQDGFQVLNLMTVISATNGVGSGSSGVTDGVIITSSKTD
jgi:hypothetical protein